MSENNFVEEEMTLIDYIKQWLNEEVKDSSIRIEDNPEQSVLSISVFADGLNTIINIDYRLQDYIEYEIVVYEYMKWKATAVFKTDFARYEDQAMSVEVRFNEPEEDLFECTDFEYAKRFIKNIIDKTLADEIQLYLLQEVTSYLP